MRRYAAHLTIEKRVTYLFIGQNMNLQRDLEDAIAQVGQLQGLMVELEGRLEEDGKAHQDALTNKDDEIQLLNQQVC